MDQREFFLTSVKLRRIFERNYEKEFSKERVTALQALMLQEISLHEGLKATDLSKLMGYNKSLVTKNIKDLSAAGYINIDHIDGRTISIKVSDDGRALLRKSTMFGRKLADGIFADCSSDEIEQFYATMSKLRIE